MTPDDYNDLPTELKAQLKTRRALGPVLEPKVLKLFAPGEILTLNELLIRYWRAEQEVLKRQQLQALVNKLTKDGGPLRRCGSGVYCLASPVQEAETSS